MTPRAFALAAVVASGLWACASPGPAAAGSRPNILLVLVDDLGWRDVSFGPQHLAEPLVQTPSVDRLAREGMTFDQGYASAPVCTPTRTSLVTGSSPARSRITYWLRNTGQDTTARWDGLAWPDWDIEGLQPGDTTLPGLLSDAGYRTIHVGKAHLGARGSPGSDPTALGFDVNVAGHGLGGPASYRAADGFSKPDGKRGEWDVPGLERWHGKDLFLTEVLAIEAEEALRETVAAGEPFFLHFAPYAVHTPIMANPRHVERFADRDEQEAAYASMVASVDAALSRLLQVIDELGLTDDTLVVFTSDNGGLAAHGRGGGARHTANAPLRSGKGSAYEGGVRVPWVVRWPGVVEPGTRNDAAIISHDLFPTLLAAAGVDVPADHAEVVDGEDLLPVFAGTGELPARDLIWHQPHFWGISGPGIQPFSSIRRGDHKLLWWHATRGVELYDLRADPAETRDLAEHDPALHDELLRALRSALDGVDAQLPTDAETGVVVPFPRTTDRR